MLMIYSSKTCLWVIVGALAIRYALGGVPAHLMKAWHGNAHDDEFL